MLNYYFSGVFPFKQPAHEWCIPKCTHRLLSCHGDYVKYGHKWASEIHKYDGQITLLLDSGAFTAWNKGHPMHLEDLMPVYDSFITNYLKHAVNIYCINLDKIPGSPGVTPPQSEIDEAIEISDRNYEKLVSAFGDRILPVFHQGESEARLADVCAMTEYICVSPRNDLHEGARVKWAREVHSKIPSTTKTHGLAATGVDMMTTVKWHSVDSAAIIFTAATGDAVLCMNGKLVQVGFSDRSSKRHIAGQHYENLHSQAQTAVREYAEARGFTPQGLSTNAEFRIALCVLSCIEWNTNHHQFKPAHVASLFDL